MVPTNRLAGCVNPSIAISLRSLGYTRGRHGTPPGLCILAQSVLLMRVSATAGDTCRETIHKGEQKVVFRRRRRSRDALSRVRLSRISDPDGQSEQYLAELARIVSASTSGTASSETLNARVQLTLSFTVTSACAHKLFDAPSFTARADVSSFLPSLAPLSNLHNRPLNTQHRQQQLPYSETSLILPESDPPTAHTTTRPAANMASISDKATPTTEIDSQHHSQDGSNDEPRPVGWMYKSRKIGPITIPYYASPKAQLILVAFVCFLCPGK